MELRQLRHFVAVARTRSFTAAATMTGVTQPALSQSIARLEQDLDCQLLIRPRSGPSREVIPTPAGAYLLDEGSRLLESFERVDRTVRRLGTEQPSPTVLLGFSPGVPQNLLAAALREVGDLASVVPLQLTWGAEFVAMQRGEADIALLQYPDGMTVDGHELHTIRTYPLVALVAEASAPFGNTLTREALRTLPVLDPGLHAAPNGLRSYWLTGEIEPPAEGPHIVGPPNRTVDEMLAFVSAGRGVAVTSGAVVDDGLPRSIRAIPITDAAPVAVGIARLHADDRALVRSAFARCAALT